MIILSFDMKAVLFGKTEAENVLVKSSVTVTLEYLITNGGSIVAFRLLVAR